MTESKTNAGRPSAPAAGSGVDYKQEDITKRAEGSGLWSQLESQSGNTLPYLLERYLLLENWRYADRLIEGHDHGDIGTSVDDLSYVHLLLAEVVTVLLSQEERIRKLEANLPNKETTEPGSDK